jgi:hypothetical protein
MPRIDGAIAGAAGATAVAMIAVTSPGRGHGLSGSILKVARRSMLDSRTSSFFMRPMSQNSPRTSSRPSGALPLKTTRTEPESSETRSSSFSSATLPTIRIGRE